MAPRIFAMCWIVLAVDLGVGRSLVAQDAPSLPLGAEGANAALTADSVAGGKPHREPNWGLAPLTAEQRQMLDERHAVKLDGKLTLANLDRSEPISTDPATPNYYIYHGQAIAMRLDVGRLAVRVREDVNDDALKRALDAAEMPVSEVSPIVVGPWRMLKLATPVKDAAEARARIEAMVKNADAEFAAPVFHSSIPGGWTTPTPEILVRLKADARPGADEVFKSIVSDWTVARSELGGMAGAYVLRGSARDGFDVMAVANRLAADSRVEWAEPNMICTGHGDIFPNDAEMNNLWGVHNTGQNVNGTVGTNDVDMNGPEGWNITRGEPGVRVLIMDNGVQQDHPDLNQDAGRDFTGGQADGVAGGGPTNMCDNHGTAVAGCVSARFNNTVGVVGIAPGCRVVSARLFVSNQPCDGNWTTQLDWTANALNWALNNGIQVTNNSNGYGVTSNAVDAAYDNTENAGLIHFASAGNSGANTIGYPASVASVNAVSNVQSDGTLNIGSQRGLGLDFAAPGTNIRTTDRTDGNGYVAGDYAWVQGTSFASPYAAGVAALVKSVRPNYNAANIELAMTAGARDYGTAGYDTNYGFGFVTALGALEAFTPASDLCNTAMVIPALNWTSPTVYTNNATVSSYYEPFETCEYQGVGTSNSVWFEFTPPGNGTINLDTFGSDYDTVLSVFNGCNSYSYFGGTITPNYAAEIACNDDAGGYQSQLLNVPVTAGIPYKIKVADYDQAPGGGALVLHVSFVFGPPGNDLCTNAYVIPGDVASFNPPVSSTVYATTSNNCNEATSTCGANGGNSHSVWYQFTPTASGALSLDTIGSDFDTVLTVYDATTWGCGNYLFNNCIYPPEIACNDDLAPGQYQSVISNTNLTHDRTYLIKIASYGSGNGGNLALHFAYSGCTSIHVQDVPVFLQTLLDPSAAASCDFTRADANHDGVVNGRDVQPFVRAIAGP